MDVKATQRLLASTGYYKFGIDGDAGKGTMNAVAVIERNNIKDYAKSPSKMSKKRRLIAAGQVILNVQGYEAGTVDGYAGHNTENALSAWEYKQIHGKAEQVPRPVIKAYTPPKKGHIPLQKDVAKYYGRAGKGNSEVGRNLTTIKLPFRLRIDYNLKQTTNKITVHKKAAPSLKAALIEVYQHYGAGKMRELGIDRYAGAYNPRKMRGGSRWSMHAYACAIDFYAAPNGLRARCPRALFCKPQYKAFLDIMEKHGWLPAIRLWGADAMHFQRARLR